MELKDREKNHTRRPIYQHHHSNKVSLAVAIASVLVGVNVSAEPIKTLEEITVTATKREVNIQNVAQSISALSSEDLKNIRAIDPGG